MGTGASSAGYLTPMIEVPAVADEAFSDELDADDVPPVAVAG
ncbi:hypothetical protein V6U81_25415 [Micromonospora sp. CPCC 205711]